VRRGRIGELWGFRRLEEGGGVGDFERWLVSRHGRVRWMRMS
jgi:hypothetical protein